MGAAFSCGKDNDDLINILKRHNYISSKKVERVFRAVDRGDYIFSTHRDQAYKDISCKVGNIHLSAPCVYCRVMEGLSLKPGLSFLNIGSGTGYLSTMAGLILGESGTNHGIEMHEDCLNYAYEHLEEFKRKSLDVDVFEFCEPVFQHGNFLNVMPNRQYDRVYCGAACPQTYEKFVKQFVKIGGILVMPYKDHLLRIKRTGKETWINYTMLPVSFASLMPPQDTADRGLLQLPLWKPRSLQELCRNSIRRHLRRMVWAENSNLEDKRPIKNLSTEHSPPGLRSGLGIPFIDDGIEFYQREVMTTLQLVMSSSMRAVFAESLDGGVYVEQETPETSSDSEEDFQSEIERLFAVCESEERNLSRNASNSEVGNEDEESMEDPASVKETPDVEMREEDEDDQGMSKQSGSNCGRSASTNMKRKSMESDESSEDSSIEDKTVSRISDSDEPDEDDDEDDDDINFVLIKKVCSMINPENQRIESSSESSSSSSSSSSSDSTGDERRTSESPKAARIRGVESKIVDENGQSSRESSSHQEQRRSEEIGSKKRVLSSYECETSERKSSAATRFEKGEGESREDSSDTSSEDEAPERTNYRRDYRPGQKRRSELKSVPLGYNGMAISRKKLYRPETEATSGTEVPLRSVDASGGEKAARDSEPSSGANFENSARPACSDSDSEINYDVCKSKRKQNFAHTIRKELFSSCMKKKIRMLPLPPPLRLYINYHREL